MGPGSRLALTRAEFGTLGEEVAARWLRRSRMRLLGRNVDAPEGELDIVALHGSELIVAEVKAGWHSDYSDPGDRASRAVLRERSLAAKRMARGFGVAHGSALLVEVVVSRDTVTVRATTPRADETPDGAHPHRG